jgi:predicted dehydrogenase
MHRGSLSRRGFIQRSLAGLAAAGFPAWYAREVLAEDERAEAVAKKRVAAVDKFVVGLIGCGGQGRGIMGWARRHKGVEVVAVCDVDKRHREAAAKSVGKDCKTYEDYRELLDRKDVNVVLIGTPDHWHTLTAIDALRKGKDVYCEKPLTLTIAEGVALVKVARDTKRIFQVGSQQRSDALFRLACELVRNGRLGKLETVETWIGANPKGGPFKRAKVPEGLNWDFWQGQTPNVPYIPQRCHYTFRWWYEYSGGKMTDWGAHHNDIAQWALGMDGSGPMEIVSKGAEPAKDHRSFNCHPTFEITYTYPGGIKLICTSKENGVRFTGEDGKWIFVRRGGIEASDQKEKPKKGRAKSKLLDEPLGKDANRLYVSNNHMGNFLECVKSRKPTICPAEVGHRSVTVCHLGVISLRLGGKKLKWDPKKEQFTGDEVGNKMLSRPMRAPWKLET